MRIYSVSAQDNNRSFKATMTHINADKSSALAKRFNDISKVFNLRTMGDYPRASYIVAPMDWGSEGGIFFQLNGTHKLQDHSIGGHLNSVALDKMLKLSDTDISKKFLKIIQVLSKSKPLRELYEIKNKLAQVYGMKEFELDLFDCILNNKAADELQTSLADDEILSAISWSKAN